MKILVLVGLVVSLVGCGGDEPASTAPTADASDPVRWFAAQGKRVVTFIGYSGSGYEDEARMLSEARAILANHDPAKTLVNIGVTPDGIGAVYGLAKSMGFQTAGIVSSQAKKYEASTSPDCDKVFFVEDETWGGFLDGTQRLAPTSEAMVAVSDEIVGIGGGDVGRDEMLAARAAGKSVTFIPADMNHERAIAKARKKGKEPPTDFRGSAHDALTSTDGS